MPNLKTALKPHPAAIAAPGTTLIPWQQCPLTTMQAASRIAGVSSASLYRFAAEGKLKLRKLAGRTLVETVGLIALVNSAEDWAPSDRAAKACASRIERATAAWEA